MFLLAFSDFASALDELGWDEVDGMLLDIGVSSMQLDTAERGFSFIADGPLDMRMNPDPGKASAWHLVNRERIDVLKRIIAEFGEDPQAGRIARLIVEERRKTPIDSTRQLATLVERAYPRAWRVKARNHPATRTFQALRMTVNDELGELRRFLERALSRLCVGGRLAVITFHSLEDRLVKNLFRDLATTCTCPREMPVCICNTRPSVEIVTKKPILPSTAEIENNHRARSAKLRVARKI